MYIGEDQGQYYQDMGNAYEAQAAQDANARAEQEYQNSLIPQSPVQLLTLMANTSTQIDVFSDGIIQAVQGGEINPLAVLVQLRAMAQASERILKEIDKNIMSEADKYPGTTFEFMGNKITKAEHGIRYDFGDCGDPVYQRLFNLAFEANGQLKERENFLKAVKAPFSLLDEGSGEVATITPPTKKSKSGLNVSIK